MQKYIIDFIDQATESDINDYLSSCGATIIKSFSAFEKVVLVECSTVPADSHLVESIIDDSDHTKHIKLLTAIPVEYPTLPSEGSKTIITEDQKDWWKVYSGSVVDLDAESFQLPLSGKGAVVYLLDSGIMSEHPDFDGADIEYLYSITDDFVDRKGHGTALASVIVGKTCGITNAKLKVVKLFDTAATTKLSDFLSALDVVYQDFTSINAYGIMNCSWSIERNEYVESKMQKIYMAGVQIVVAAGNTGSDIGNVTPAAMPEALVVGSYNAHLEPCDFSDYTGTSAISVTAGSTNTGQLSGWAPGENIYCATLDGSYGFVSGTSISAAIHSAILAYNMTLPAFQFDDSTAVVWNDATRNRLSYFIKQNLLLLDDTKYQNSPNLVSLLITDTSDPYESAGLTPEMFAPLYWGTLSRVILFNPKSVSSVEVHDPLPEGLVLNNYGILSGYVDTPMEEDRVDYSVNITVTDNSGNSEDAVLEIAIVKKLPEHVPSDPSEALPYTLNASCGAVQCTTNAFCSINTCFRGQTCHCLQLKTPCQCV